MERPINKKIVLLSFLSVLLTFVYNNCGKMSVTQNKNKSLSSRSFEQLFGAQTDSFDMEHLSGSIGFDKAEITEGDTAKFSWTFNWGIADSNGFKLSSFNCTNGLLPQNSSTDPEQLLKVTGGCDSLIGSCTWHANGEMTLSGVKASDAPYSCQIQFLPISSSGVVNENKKLSVSIKVKSANNSSTNPTPNKCEGNELLQGNLERCDDTNCVGWAFEYGQVASKVGITIIQSGEFLKTAEVYTTTTQSRSDVNAYLAQQGCLNTGNLLTEFSVPRSQIENAINSAPAQRSQGYGAGAQFQISATLYGLSNTIPIGSNLDYTPSSTNTNSAKVSFSSSNFDTEIIGKATGLSSNPSWCLSYGHTSCTPNLSNMQDWTQTNAGSGVYNYTYNIKPFQKEFCPGDYSVYIKDQGNLISTSFTIFKTNFYAASGGLSVYNVPPSSIGTLLGCFEYDQDYGSDHKPGSCGGQGTTALTSGNGWNYSSTSHTASFSGDSSVFGGHHGKIYFTYKYNCGPTETVSQTF